MRMIQTDVARKGEQERAGHKRGEGSTDNTATTSMGQDETQQGSRSPSPAAEAAWARKPRLYQLDLIDLATDNNVSMASPSHALLQLGAAKLVVRLLLLDAVEVLY